HDALPISPGHRSGLAVLVAQKVRDQVAALAALLPQAHLHQGAGDPWRLALEPLAQLTHGLGLDDAIGEVAVAVDEAARESQLGVRPHLSKLRVTEEAVVQLGPRHGAAPWLVAGCSGRARALDRGGVFIA